jgi:hypothetical protein
MFDTRMCECTECQKHSVKKTLGTDFFMCSTQDKTLVFPQHSYQLHSRRLNTRCTIHCIECLKSTQYKNNIVARNCTKCVHLIYYCIEYSIH